MFEKIKQLMTGNLSKGGRQVYIDDLRVIASVFVIGVRTALNTKAKHKVIRTENITPIHLLLRPCSI